MNMPLVKKFAVRTHVCQCPWGEGVVAGGEEFAHLVVAGDEDALVSERAYGFICRVEGNLAELGLCHGCKDFVLICCECMEQAFLFGLGVEAMNELISRNKPYDQWFVKGTREADDERHADDVAVVVCELGDAEEFYGWLRKHKECRAAYKHDTWCLFCKEDFEELCKVAHAADDNTK